MFVGRERELARLQEMYDSQRFEMAVVYGRRRVGKTMLINEFCREKSAIYFVGLETTEKENLLSFSRAVWAVTMPGRDMPPFASYRELFAYVGETAREQRLILVIDEYPYLAKATPGISSVLQACIDGELLHGRLFLILCGSSMSFMERQVLGYKSPLYGRRTGQFKIAPFSFWEARRMLPGFTGEEQAVLYGVTGGVPEYLARIRKGASVDQNIVTLFFDPSGRLFEEPVNLLKQELSEPAVYNAVVKAIADGHSRLNEIATAIGRETSATVAFLNALMELGLVEKETPAGEKPGRKTVYQLRDQMFRFWYRYVSPNVSAISAGHGEAVYQGLVRPRLPDFMGRVFEVMVRDELLRALGSGALPFLFGEIGRWWGADPAARGQAEIDLLAENGEQALFVECKWRNDDVNVNVLNDLEHKASLFPHKKRYLYLFSKTGFTDACRRQAERLGNVTLVSFAEMCRE